MKLLACLLVLLTTVYANAQSYAISGKAEYVWIVQIPAQTNPTVPATHRAVQSTFPEGTTIELYVKPADPRLVQAARVGSAGSFAFNANVTATDQVYVVISLDTWEGTQHQVHFVNGSAEHQAKSKPFTCASNPVAVDLIVGKEANTDFNVPADSDLLPTAGATGKLREWAAISGGRSEEEFGRMAATLDAMTQAFREVKGSAGGGQIAFGSQYLLGWQKVNVPTGSGGVSWPDSWNIEMSMGACKPSTGVHELGHVVHYHSTVYTWTDLAVEVLNGGHYFDTELSRQVAYAEGWAEFFQWAFISGHPTFNDQLYDWSTEYAVAYGVVYTADSSASYWWDSWKGHDRDGRDNSGEIVEGAVAHIMWRQASPSANVASTIEPVWQYVRQGATTTTRNQHKRFKDYYDLRVAGGGGTGGQAFRDICDELGITYSRSKVTQFVPVAATDHGVSSDDLVWLSQRSKIKAEQMSTSNLEVERITETLSDVAFEFWGGSSDRYLWTPETNSTKVVVKQSDLLTTANWTQLASDNTWQDGFFGFIDGKPLKNQYYIVRSRVKGDSKGIADHYSGPGIEPRNFVTTYNTEPNADSAQTAKWWHDMGIVYQIKLDAVPPKAAARKPASN